MTTYWLSPIYNGIQFTNSDGAPLSGGSIYTYVGGSYTTEATTFADNTGTPNTNPIILDSSGRLPNVGIWLDSTQSYNFVLSNGSIILDRVANVTGVPIPVSSSSSNIIWNTITPAPTYVSTTSFLVPGSFTTQFAVGNRVQILNSTSAYQYATVTAVSYSSGNTNVTVQNDSTALSSLMVQVAWSDLVANGATVDAGAVSYTSSLSYASSNTVGGVLKAGTTNITTLLNNYAISNTVWATSGGAPNYTITTTPAPTSLTTPNSFQIQFQTASTGVACTLNVNGLGAKNLLQWGPSGAEYPNIFAGQTVTVIYDGNYIIQNAAPYAITIPNNGIGTGQNWVDVTSSRAFSTVYTNNYQTDKPIMVSVGLYGGSGNPSGAFLVNGVVAGYPTSEYGHISEVPATFIVPYGFTYEIVPHNSPATIYYWAELR